MSDFENIVIVGATGLVGSNFASSRYFAGMTGVARSLPDWWPKDRAFAAVDVFSTNVNWNQIVRPGAPILFLAFPTSIDKVESYTQEDVSIILNGFQVVLAFAKENHSPLMFVSSDAVMWGAPPSLRDLNCPITPVNKYGALKGKCEQLMARYALPAGTCVVRCTPVGLHPYSKGHGFLSSMIERAKDGPVKGFTDSMISPISCDNFLQFTKCWLKAIKENQPVPGIIHIGSSASVSKYDVIKATFARHFMEGKIEPARFDPIFFKVSRVADQSFAPSPIKWFRPLTVSDVLSTI